MTLTPARFAARISSPESPDGPRSLPASDAFCHRCHVVIVITTSLLLQQSLSERSSCMLVPWGMLLTYQIHCGQRCVIAGQMRKRRACTPHTHAARRRASARSRGATGSLPLEARPAGAAWLPRRRWQRQGAGRSGYATESCASKTQQNQLQLAMSTATVSDLDVHPSQRTPRDLASLLCRVNGHPACAHGTQEPHTHWCGTKQRIQ